MIIGYDASRAFVAEATGTENYSLNLLKALAKVDRENTYRVYLRSQSGKSAQRFVQDDPEFIEGSKWRVWPLAKNKPGLEFPYKPGLEEWPKNFEFKTIRPYRLWTQVGLAWETWRNPVDLLFIPAHTLPIIRKRRIGISNCSLKRIFLRKSKFQISNFPKTVVTIHDLGVEYLPGYHQFPQRYYFDFASRYAARHADALIAVSAATKKDLNRYRIDPKKIFVVHEGVDRTFFRPRSKKEIQISNFKFKINDPYILFVGTIQPRKNLAMLIEAFGLLVGSRELVASSKDKNSTNYRLQTTNLVIVGKLGWDYKDILAAPKKFGVEGKVKFLGHVPNADLPALYTGAAVFAAPSFFEGFGLPILEAVACGCPVVASDIAAHREIQLSVFGSRLSDLGHLVSQATSLKTEKQKTGKLQSENRQRRTDNNILVPMTLVKPNDVDQWVNVLYQIISQHDLRSTLVTSGFSRLNAFSWEKCAEETLAVFNRVLR
jgi:glycosyltransferase involved in cell wall biosynthesis